MKKLLKTLLCGLLAAVSAFAVIGVSACTKNDPIVVYTNAFFAPFEYYQGTKIVGVDVDIMDLVGKKMNKEIKIEDKDFSVLIDTTAEGKLCDCAAAGITVTEARQKKVDFSIPYYTSVQYVILPTSSDIVVSKNSDNEDVIFWSSLAGKKIGVQLDTTGNIYVDLEIKGEHDVAEGEEEYTGELEGTGATCVPFDTAQLAYDGLKAGTSIDVVIVDKLPAQYLIKNDTATYTALPLYYDAESATSEDYAIAVNKNKKELLEAINAVLTELLAQVDDAGTNGVEQLVMKHFAVK